MTAPDRTDSRDELRSVIVDAAARLLRNEGAHAVTTRAVARAAGVQAPAIYRLFGDKDRLIDAVADHVMATYVMEKAAAAARTDGDPVDELRDAWLRHVDFGLENAELYALLAAPGRESVSPATAAGVEILRTRVRRIAAAGRLQVDEQRALEMIHAAGTGTVLALLGAPEDERDAGLPDAMFEAVAAAILTAAPAAGDATVNAVAVTFLAVLEQLPSLTDAERTLMAEWVARALAQLRQQ